MVGTHHRIRIAACAAAIVAGAVVAVGGGAAPAGAAVAGCGDNVRWTSSNGTSGGTSMSGAFGDGTTVNLTLSSGASNSGSLFYENWSATPQSDDAFSAGIESAGDSNVKTAAAVSGATTGTTVTVTFGATVTDPVIFTNYIDPSTVTFSQSVTLLDGNPDGAVTVNGSAVSHTGGGQSTYGYAVRVSGTFGPSTSLVFTYTNTNNSNDTMGITFVKAGGSGGDCTGPACTSDGFFSPVAMGGVVNVVKAGATVPLKFRTSCEGIERGDLAVVSSFDPDPITCPTGAASVSTATSSGPTKLTYDRKAAQYVQHWQTPKTPRDACYTATVTIADGSTHTALFRTR